MRKTTKSPGEKIVKDIKRATRKHYSSEEKIRIVLDGLRGEDSIAELCRREGISQGIYYKWSKDFMEAGKKRLAGDTARAANTDEGTVSTNANSSLLGQHPCHFMPHKDRATRRVRWCGWP
jgi:transposase